MIEGRACRFAAAPCSMGRSMRLMREYRFCLPRSSPSEKSCTNGNSWAGTREDDPVVGFLRARAAVDGSVDARSGFVCDVRRLDELIREHVVERIRHDRSDEGALRVSDLGMMLPEIFGDCSANAPAGTTLARLELLLSEHTSLSIQRSAPKVVEITESFEFSASHRLACSDLSDEENRKLFGKCSNPHGHGHNYVLEVTVRGTPDHRTGGLVPVGTIDRTVREQVIDPFDHKNLNVELPEFGQLNPTVENIASVIWDRLSAAFGADRLARVRVWETAKTYAERRSSDIQG